MSVRKGLVLAVLLLISLAWADSPSQSKKVALVIEVKGQVLKLPLRSMERRTALQAFQGVEPDRQIALAPGSSLTLAFVSNNKRFNLENTTANELLVTVASEGFRGVEAQAIPVPQREARSLPLKALDLSKMGGFSSRSLGLFRAATLEARPTIELGRMRVKIDLNNPAPVVVYWRKQPQDAWQKAGARLEHLSDARTVLKPEIELSAGQTYQLHINATPENGEKAEYHLDLYRPTLQELKELEAVESRLKARLEMEELFEYIASLNQAGLIGPALEWLHIGETAYPDARDWVRLRNDLLTLPK